MFFVRLTSVEMPRDGAGCVRGSGTYIGGSVLRDCRRQRKPLGAELVHVDSWRSLRQQCQALSVWFYVRACWWLSSPH